MKVKIEIDTNTFIRFWLVVIGFALAGLAIYSARVALIIIGVSIFLAVALSPFVNRLAKLLSVKRSHRILSIAIAYVVVSAILVAVIFLAIPPIVEQMIKFAQTVPSLLDSISYQSNILNHFVSRYGWDNIYGQILDSLKGNATKFASTAGASVIVGISSIAWTVISMILVFVLTFLMLAEGPIWIERLWGMYGNKEKMEHHRYLLHRMYSVLTGYIVGQLSVAAIAGVMTSIVVFVLSLIFNIPSSLIIPSATIAFIMTLIPVFGATIGYIIICLVLLLNSPQAALAYLIYFMIYQQIEGNLISPHIQAKKLNLSPLMVLIAITIGIYMFGIIGAIISIPIAGCVNVLIEDHCDRNKAEQEKPKKKIISKTA